MKETTKILAERIEKQRAKNREDVAAWRKRNPEKNRIINLRYYKKKRDAGYFYKTGVGWTKKSGGNK
jgi:hypothetical protein